MLYVFLVVLVVSIFILLPAYKSADSAKIKRIKRIALIIGGLIIAILLIRFGMPYIAALLGGAMALIATFSRLIQILSTVDSLKGLFKKPQSDATQKTSTTAKMTKEQAFKILEISENASKEEIEEAYKRLMKKNHPDVGGTEYFASQLNEAKDLLLKGR
jgi:hypothetical protein